MVSIVWLLLAANCLWPLATSPPRRIVSTAPSITEILFALGLGDRVVGVTVYCRYPPAAQRLPKIGTYTTPNLEAILRLRPDLVIVQENPVRLRERMERVGLRVLELPHTTLDDLFTSIQLVATAAGVPARGAQVVQSLKRELTEIEQRTQPLPRRRVVFVVSRLPSALEQIRVVGGSSYLNRLLEIAGGENVFRDVASPYPQVSLETLMAKDPEVILDATVMGSSSTSKEATLESTRKLWSRLRQLAAVRRNAIFALESELFVVPGPRVTLAARALARMLHPELIW